MSRGLRARLEGASEKRFGLSLSLPGGDLRVIFSLLFVVMGSGGWGMAFSFAFSYLQYNTGALSDFRSCVNDW